MENTEKWGLELLALYAPVSKAGSIGQRPICVMFFTVLIGPNQKQPEGHALSACMTSSTTKPFPHSIIKLHTVHMFLTMEVPQVYGLHSLVEQIQTPQCL